MKKLLQTSIHPQTTEKREHATRSVHSMHGKGESERCRESERAGERWRETPRGGEERGSRVVFLGVHVDRLTTIACNLRSNRLSGQLCTAEAGRRTARCTLCRAGRTMPRKGTRTRRWWCRLRPPPRGTGPCAPWRVDETSGLTVSSTPATGTKRRSFRPVLFASAGWWVFQRPVETGGGLRL